ncbi:class I SAM-dependent methyltransferase [Bradyrhizobium sp. USDA 3240]
MLQNAALQPYCCEACGLVFEARGVREFSGDFYEKTFRPKPMMRVYGNTGSVPRPEKATNLIAEMLPNLPDKGEMLEVGSGKGAFLGGFAKRHPDWSLTGIEPSILFNSIAEAAPGATLHHGGYESFDCPRDSKDLIVSLGVIEHVDNPLGMLEWISAALKPGGLAFLEAPNFNNHPGDLLCADHLSKLTPEVMTEFAANVGLQVIEWRDLGVPMYFALRKAGSRKSLVSQFMTTGLTATKNATITSKMVDAVAQARDAAQRSGEKFGTFGLAIPGLFAPLYLKMPATDITAYIDDNAEMHGTKVHDRPIVGPSDIAKLGIKHVALSMSPRYTQPVVERMNAMGVKTYV